MIFPYISYIKSQNKQLRRHRLWSLLPILGPPPPLGWGTLVPKPIRHFRVGETPPWPPLSNCMVVAALRAAAASFAARLQTPPENGTGSKPDGQRGHRGVWTMTVHNSGGEEVQPLAAKRFAGWKKSCRMPPTPRTPIDMRTTNDVWERGHGTRDPGQGGCYERPRKHSRPRAEPFLPWDLVQIGADRNMDRRFLRVGPPVAPPGN